MPDGVDTAHAVLDIGTGASCIYPLLAAIMHPQWTFLATDVDDEAVRWATRNVDKNRALVADRIRVIKTTQDERTAEAGTCVRQALQGTEVPLSAVMCNPPFFERATDKASVASRACAANEGELAIDGGGTPPSDPRLLPQQTDNPARRTRHVPAPRARVGPRAHARPMVHHARRHPRQRRPAQTDPWRTCVASGRCTHNRGTHTTHFLPRHCYAAADAIPARPGHVPSLGHWLVLELITARSAFVQWARTRTPPCAAGTTTRARTRTTRATAATAAPRSTRRVGQAPLAAPRGPVRS